jgi:hypothetical protein
VKNHLVNEVLAIPLPRIWRFAQKFTQPSTLLVIPKHTTRYTNLLKQNTNPYYNYSRTILNLKGEEGAHLPHLGITPSLERMSPAIFKA